jgi:hypothetical protein
MKKAHKTIESVYALEAICEEINNLVLQQKTSDAIALGYITESVRRVGNLQQISQRMLSII